MSAAKLCVALDLPSFEDAMSVGRRVAPHADILKVGLQQYAAAGPAAFDAVARLGREVFADVKLHDIPATVAGAAALLARHRVDFLTVHLLGGGAMLEAALEASARGANEAGRPRPRVLGVTVLTSLGSDELSRAGIGARPADLVGHLARLAAGVGLDGVVCSVDDLDRVGSEAPGLLRVVPGIRAAAEDPGDQQRTGAIETAVRRGADVIVMGRSIVRADDPGAAAAAAARGVHALAEGGC